MFLSLVLATYGRVDELYRLFQSLATQTNMGFEVVLVDQNLDDRLVACVAKFLGLGLKINHLRTTIPNLSAARNLGIKSANGDIVGFPDDDCWYDPDTIENIYTFFDSGKRIDAVVANWVEQTAGAMQVSLDAVLQNDSWRRFRGGYASSITLFFRMCSIKEFGGFDERLGVGLWFGSGEDTDVVMRALEGGAVIHRNSKICVHHIYRAVTAANPMQYRRAVRKRERGTGALYVKHKLSAYTIIRGLLAPLLIPVVQLEGWHAMHIGLAASLGRLEGMLGWKRTASRALPQLL